MCSVDGCDLPAKARGMCNRHYSNQHRYGHAVPLRERPLMERLTAVGWDVTASGCWEWRGSRNGHGYGLYNHNRVHRLMFGLAHPEEPAPPVVRHRCDNPPCVNPEHLLPGTRADNSRDMKERGRRKRKVCPHGHDRTVPGATSILSDGEEICMACARERNRRYRARKSAA